MIIPFNARYRRVWMFPRNIRKIYPWKVAQVCQHLQGLANDTEWDGNQVLQNSFSASLEQANLKNGGEKIDPKSGGARTYISQLECLGLVYKSEGALKFTLAGKSLLEMEEPLRVVQSQLLNHQYPSAYGAKPNVKIDPRIRIKPFLFLLALMQDVQIQYLENLEFIFPVVYGHNWDCFENCKKKILAFRADSSGDVTKHIDNFEEDFYLPRSGSETNPFANVEAIANTAKNYLESAVLVQSEIVDKKQRISVNPDYQDVINRAIQQRENYIPNPTDQVSFQRAYGAWNRNKDTSRESQPKRKTKGESLIIARFMEYVGGNLVIDNADKFVDQMVNQFGFKKTDVEAVISPYIDKALSFFEAKYIELSKGGTATATDFEKATVQLLVDRLGIDALHIGSKRKTYGVGAYMDVLVDNEDNKSCGLIDTKASSLYNVPSSDYAKMLTNYIPNYEEVSKKDRTLDFVSYIAGGFSGEINSKLRSITENTGIYASAVTAKVLIDVLRTKDITLNKKKTWEVFKINRVLAVEDFV